MEAATGIIIEGIKQFGGEIIGGILFAVALWMFPGLRKFFGRDKARNEDDTEAETRRQLEILQEELRKAEEKRLEEERVKAEIQSRQEELRQAGAKSKRSPQTY